MLLTRLSIEASKNPPGVARYFCPTLNHCNCWCSESNFWRLWSGLAKHEAADHDAPNDFMYIV